MTKTETWRCDCGTVAATVHAGRAGTVVCYCRYCRAFARHLGHGHILDAAGGTRLALSVPDRVRITTGRGALGVLRLSRRGPFRWFASCCNAPFVNIYPNPGIPYASVIAAGLADAADPAVTFRAFRSSALSPVQADRGSALRVGLGIAWRAVNARLRGGHRGSDFFGDDGAPSMPPIRLSRDERARVLDPAAPES